MGIGVAGAAALNVDTTFGRAARLERAAQAASLLSVAELALGTLRAVDEQAAVWAEIGLPALGSTVARTALDTFEHGEGYLVVLRLRRQQELLGGQRNCGNLADFLPAGKGFFRKLRKNLTCFSRGRGRSARRGASP